MDTKIEGNTSQSQEEFVEKYFVVKNEEEQFSIWPSYKDMAPGWQAIGDERTKEECLEYINEVWTDMRPLSLRKKMESDQGS